MSTLTKISIVVLVVLVLFACPIFIQSAATPYNWKQAYENQVRQTEIARADARDQQVATDAVRGMLDAERAAREGLSRQYETDVLTRSNEISRLSQLLTARDGTIKELTASQAGLQNALNQAVALNKAQASELDRQRAQNIQLADQLRNATAKNDQYLNEMQLLTRSRQVLQEQVAEREQELKDLRQEYERLKGSVGATVAAEKPAVVGPRVSGTITAVKDDLASINVGSASGVKKNMEFIIYRDGEFVAHLQIELVDTATSSGIIVDAQRDVRVGDKVTTSLALE